MFIALDSENNRVWADGGLSRNTSYFCPVCNEPVRLRAGSCNSPHFAHIVACTDGFSSDMSDWHRNWQALFPKKNREVVISYNGETHRADVLCYGTVIEFQHSPISGEEFRRRNAFYTGAGYYVVWIFDLMDYRVSEDWRADFIDHGEWSTSWGYGSILRWKRPWRFLEGFFPQDERMIDIFFQWGMFGFDPKDPDEYYFERISWVNSYREPAWGHMRTDLQAPGNWCELVTWLKERWEKGKTHRVG